MTSLIICKSGSINMSLVNIESSCGTKQLPWDMPHFKHLGEENL